MICPLCRTRLRIIDSRLYDDNLRIRVYECPKCGYRESTEERLPKNKSK